MNLSRRERWVAIAVTVVVLAIPTAYALLPRNHADRARAEALRAIQEARLADAEPPLMRWGQLRPNDAEAFKRLLSVRHGLARAEPAAGERLRRMEAAADAGLQAVELDPADDDVAAEVAWLCLQTGRLDEADRLCRRCRVGKPDDPWLTYLLARIGRERGLTEEARTLLDGLLLRHPQSARSLLLRAVLYNESGESEKAVPLLRRALAVSQESRKETLHQLAVALARSGQAEEARQIAAEVEKLNRATLEDAVEKGRD